MQNRLVIADSGPIISLVIIDKLDILETMFNEIKIPKAVWDELTSDESKPFYKKIHNYFKNKIEEIKGFNELTFIMDSGESEAVILYKELQADFLLIDDKKARTIAENFNINCVGTIGLLSAAKDKGLINELKPLFINFLSNKRYYSIELLNSVLIIKGESTIRFHS